MFLMILSSFTASYNTILIYQICLPIHLTLQFSDSQPQAPRFDYQDRTPVNQQNTVVTRKRLDIVCEFFLPWKIMFYMHQFTARLFALFFLLWKVTIYVHQFMGNLLITGTDMFADPNHKIGLLSNVHSQRIKFQLIY